MNLRLVQKILGWLLGMFSLTMLPPILVARIYNEDSGWAFFWAFVILSSAGLLIASLARNTGPLWRIKGDLRLRDGFLVVALFWVVLGSVGSVPLLLSDQPSMTATDAIFESVSGLTTTGATVLSGLDQLPYSVLYYRQQLQWLGGMGIIVLAVAVLPMLGVGGMQLYRAETPGPVKETKLTPRITETAKQLWFIYLGITVLCGVAYLFAGMGLFDAISHAFSTVAIGGFSTHDASIGHFDNPMIEMVAVVFMFIAGINFSLHFVAWRRVTIQGYLNDPEFRAYTTILATLITVTVLYLYISGVYPRMSDAFTKGLFQAVSIATTTGFTTAEYSAWPGSLPVMLILASFIGGCAGSTGGGIKVIRSLLLYRQGVREVIRLVHPSAEIPVKLGHKAVQHRVVDSVWGFFSIYIVLFGIMMLALLATGLDQVTAFSAVAATLNNLGPGLGDVSANFASISNFDKWICISGMLFGRLEIFTLLVLLTPTFWRR